MKQQRRKRLQELLLSQRFNGDRARFCAAAGLTNGRLSQLLNPAQQFGDNAAARLCDALGLPDGYFDAAQGSQIDDATARVYADAITINVSQQALLLAQWLDMLPDQSMRSDAFAECVATFQRMKFERLAAKAQTRDVDAAGTSVGKPHARAAAHKTHSTR